MKKLFLAVLLISTMVLGSTLTVGVKTQAATLPEPDPMGVSAQL